MHRCLLFCLLFVSVFATPLIFAQGNGPLRIFTITPGPSPQQLSDAKQALANGQIVMMEGDDLVQFDNLLGVGLQLNQPDSPSVATLQKSEGHENAIAIGGLLLCLPLVAFAGIAGADRRLRIFCITIFLLVGLAGLSSCGGAAVNPEPAPPVTPGPEILRLMAVHLAATGSLHSYECFTPQDYTPTGQNTGKDCNAAFQYWVSQEQEPTSASYPEPLAAAWTELGRPDIDYYDGSGNLFRDWVRLYRVNDNDFSRDWYLIARDPLSQPNFQGCGSIIVPPCGWMTHMRDLQTSLDRSLVSNPGFAMYEWSPVSSISNGVGQVNIGASLAGAVPQPGVGYSFSWNQEQVTTQVPSNAPQKEASWVENFNPPLTNKTPNNSGSFISHNAMIFQVPEGTTRFNVNLYAYFQSRFQAPFKKEQFDSRTISRPILLSAPEFQVTPTSVTLVPKGNATIAVTAGVPGYNYQGVRWVVIKEPSGFSVTPTSGSGPLHVTVQATSAQAGDEDYIQFQTDPPYAAPSVARSPLTVKVTVVDNPEKLPPHGVLLTGGTDWNGRVLSSAEVFDPTTSTSTLTLPMLAERTQHTATLLANGKILIAGGFDTNGSSQSSAELFDPQTRSFSPTGAMTVPRAMQTATLLTVGPHAGEVLIVGGCSSNSNGVQALTTAELYNPSTGTFTATGKLVIGTMSHTATALSDGTVLITGGVSTRGSYSPTATAQIFDIATSTFRSNGSIPSQMLQAARQGHTAALLPNGQVLISGGWNSKNDPIQTAELYTPGSGTFAYTLGPMEVGRRYLASAALLDGRVFTVGGNNGAMSGGTYDPSTSTFNQVLNIMAEPRDYPTATLIFNTETGFDGKVLLAGGVINGLGSSGGKQIELYDPNFNDFSTAGQMTTPRSGLTTTFFNTAP